MALFVEHTEEDILELLLEVGEEKGVDTREGSVFFDSVSAVALRLAELFTDATIIAEQSSIFTASGEQLDMLAEQLYLTKLHREKAVNAKYKVVFTFTEGVSDESIDLEEEDRFFVDDIYFNLEVDDNGEYYLIAEEPGIEANNIPIGSAVVPVETIEDLESATITELVTVGVDEEEDEDFRARILEMLSAPAENANVQQYKTWCEEINGVGSATIYPLFAGPNTVKAVLTDSQNNPCSDELLSKVQNYIDPMTEAGKTEIEINGSVVQIGDGLGGGVAPIGAHFLAVSAEKFDIVIDIQNLIIGDDVSLETVKANIKSEAEAYIKSCRSTEDSTAVIKYHRLVSLIASIEGVEDFDSITINDIQGNIDIPTGYIPVLEGVNYGT